MRAVVIDEWGGPDVLQVREDAPDPVPGDGQVLVRVSRSGINFADTHARENSYLARYELPYTPGGEIAGTTEDGRRVAALVGSGGYAEVVAVAESQLVPIPEGVSDGTALALILQGLTAWHLYRTVGRVAEGETVVVVAAAGGVGSLAVQLGKPMGAGRVIALASTEEKRELALELGADVALDPAREDLSDALREANGGKRIDVAFEMAGGPTFDACLKAMAPFGRLVTYGIASGESNRPSTNALMRGSIAVIGYWLVHSLREPVSGLVEPLSDLFARVARGELRVVEGETYPMSEVRRAHEDLQARRTSGKLLLDPSA
jgi:NADPH2:quinone reductase